MRFKISQVVALILLIALFIPATVAGQSPEPVTNQAANLTPIAEINLDGAIRGPDNRVRVIVELVDAPLAAYTGGVSGLKATSLEMTGGTKLSVTASASRAYLNYLADQQAAFGQALSRQVPSASIDYRYQIVFNGVAMAVDPDEAANLLKLPGVKNVYPDRLVYGAVDGSIDLIQAPAAWADLGGQSEAGRGIFVAVIDTGIRPENPMFSGAGFTMPPGFPKGYCATNPDDPTFQCNNKLVAARVYNMPSEPHPAEVMTPLDINGHGSHVAGVAVGNPINLDLGQGSPTPISGVAPAAYLMVYKALFHVTDPERTDGVGAGSALLAALNDAVADGADVINNSWGSLPQEPNDPGETPYAEAVTNATKAGVLAVFSAGNNGPDAGTIVCPACVEDALAVAASTTTRLDTETFDLTGPGTVPATLTGLGVWPGDGPALTPSLEGSLKYAGTIDPANSEGCQPFPANAFANSLALIQRGTCTFVTKVTNAANAGAIAVIVFKITAGPPTTMIGLEETLIPSVMISQNDGEALRDWLIAHPDATGRINPEVSRVKNDTWPDFVAGFSSVGPNIFDPSLLKPDITAPGVSILSAYSPDNPDTPGKNFEYKYGTSMAAPHVTGAAALMLQLHPTWTPYQIKTALTSTAMQNLRNLDVTPATPFNMGAGRLDLDRARRAGLTFDQPSFAHPACPGSCTWTYQVTNVLEVASTWTVTATNPAEMGLTITPATLTLEPDETQEITITANVSALSLDEWHLGEIILQPDLTTTVDAHLPFALQPSQPKDGLISSKVFLPVVVK